MKVRFGDQKRGLGPHDFLYVHKKAHGVGYFMHHPERQYKIGLHIDAKVIRPTKFCDQICRKPLLCCPPIQSIQHPFLDIDGNNPSILPHEVTHGNGKITFPWPYIYGCETGPDIGRKHPVGLLDDSAQRIVKGEA